MKQSETDSLGNKQGNGFKLERNKLKGGVGILDFVVIDLKVIKNDERES